MFDCPEQSHTSPIITLVNLMVSELRMVMSKGPPAAGVATFSIHVAPFEVITESVVLFQPVVRYTVEPGPDQPQKVTESFCCKTIPEDKIAGNLSCAKEEVIKPLQKNKNTAAQKCLILKIGCFA